MIVINFNFLCEHVLLGDNWTNLTLSRCRQCRLMNPSLEKELHAKCKPKRFFFRPSFRLNLTGSTPVVNRYRQAPGRKPFRVSAARCRLVAEGCDARLSVLLPSCSALYLGKHFFGITKKYPLSRTKSLWHHLNREINV